MERVLNLVVTDKRAPTWWKIVRVLLLVGLVAFAWKSGYDQGGEDMLNNFLIEPRFEPQKELFTFHSDLI